MHISTPSFSAERMARLASMERWHFWFTGRRRLIHSLLAAHQAPGEGWFVDAGCGTGLLLEALERNPARALGLDLRPEGLAAARQQRPGAALAQADAGSLPLADGSASLVFLLDVIEHMDDQAALAEAQRVLKPGGLLIITVPALPWLWSYRDTAAGHRRRYTRGMLADVCAQHGFDLLTMKYYAFFLFPAAALTRLAGRRTPSLRDLEDRPSRPLNFLFSGLLALEVWLGRCIQWPWGTSLAAVAQKAGQAQSFGINPTTPGAPPNGV